MVTLRAEKAYEKYAWILLFVLGIVPVVSAIVFAPQGGRGREPVLQSQTGLTWDQLLAEVPGIGNFLAEVQHVLDTYAVGFGIFVMAISRFSYRKGERWAWYVLWMVPAVLVSIIVNDVNGGWPTSGYLGLPLLTVALLGLLLPYRKFFPRKS